MSNVLIWEEKRRNSTLNFVFTDLAVDKIGMRHTVSTVSLCVYLMCLFQVYYSKTIANDVSSYVITPNYR